MSNKIYTVESNDGMTIFNDVEALGTELRDVLFREIEGIWEEEADRWNNWGEEYQVEPSYAFACMLYESLTRSRRVQDVARSYGMGSLSLPGFTVNGYWDWKDMQGMKDCHACLDEMVEWRDEFVNCIKTTFPSGGFTYKNSGYNHRTGDEWTRTVTVKVVDLDKEFFNAPKVKINQTSMARSEAEYESHYNSKEGKAERKAAAERRAEISMTMMENGWHNMSTDDDGTVRMW